MNENLKKQEQEFKAHCKEEMARLKANIEKLKSETDSEKSEDQVRIDGVLARYAAVEDSDQALRL